MPLARRYSSWPSLFFSPDQVRCLDEGLTSSHAGGNLARTSSWREALRDNDKERQCSTAPKANFRARTFLSSWQRGGRERVGQREQERKRKREKVCYTFNILCTDIRETETVGCVVSLETSYSKRIDRTAFEMRACLYRKRTLPSSIPSAILFERFYSRFNQRIDISVNDRLGCLLNEWLICN